MEAYLADPASAAHVSRVARSKLHASGQDPDLWDSMSDDTRHQLLAAFFTGGHDVTTAWRRLTGGVIDTTGLAGSGTLAPAEYRVYMRLAVTVISDLYRTN